MKEFFRNPFKVAVTSLIATICVLILLMCVLNLSGFDSTIVHMIGKVVIAISLPFLILNPLFGFIYSFFIKGKMKILYIILHLACICTISVFAFMAFMFRYFVLFAP
ncbi:hypothetical protein [Bacillus multifaciens]|uniref:hypothetical protein n=1 Tax=Bacillus multifaciens TaxID=3068506 RepID=UPI002741EF5A|nr:hypothetical protein [Bacillus sp. WLY-B-L8]MDP7980029.1 hypothetical protein [Bacillus sp. WLY-B-L8]